MHGRRLHIGEVLCFLRQFLGCKDALRGLSTLEPGKNRAALQSYCSLV